MNDAVLVGSRTTGHRIARHGRAPVTIHRLVPERTPQAFEDAGVGVEHDNTVVAIPIGDEQLVGRGMNTLVRRLMEVVCVGVSTAPVAPPDLQDKLTVQGELQHLIVRDRLEPGEVSSRTVVPTNPGEPLMVDVEAMLPLRPVIALASPAPRPDEGTCRIEPDDGRRSHLGVFASQGPRAVQQPHIVLRVDRNGRHVTQLPVSRHLWPVWIHAESGNSRDRSLGGLSGHLCVNGLATQANKDHPCHQPGTEYIPARHDFPQQ